MASNMDNGNEEDCIIDVVSVNHVNVPTKSQTSTSKVKLRCTACEFSTKSKSKIHSHLVKKHLTLTSYKCDECGHVALSKKLLRKHSKKHKSYQKPLDLQQCSFCSFKTTTFELLSKHYRFNHYRKKPWVCSVCHSTFKTEYELSEHDFGHPPVELLLFCCGICGYRAGSRSKIKTHTIKHHFNNFTTHKK